MGRNKVVRGGKGNKGKENEGKQQIEKWRIKLSDA